MTDLTKIEKPFGLLDEATQKALRECGGPWEVVSDDGWEDNGGEPAFWSHMTYKQKPQPPKPREFWLCGDFRFHGLAGAEEYQFHKEPHAEIIHVREVLE